MKRPSIMQQQIERYHQLSNTILLPVVVQVYMSFRIGKVEKDKALNYHLKQGKETNKVV